MPPALEWVCFFFGVIGGHAMIGQSGHKVGVPQDSEGLPFLNWSTMGGDFRVMHFMGVHAMQLLPLLTFYVTRKKLFSEKQMSILALVIGIGYFLVMLYLYNQAKAGVPFIGLTP